MLWFGIATPFHMMILLVVERFSFKKVLLTGFDDSSWPIQTKNGRHAGEVRLIMHYSNANKPMKAMRPQHRHMEFRTCLIHKTLHMDMHHLRHLLICLPHSLPLHLLHPRLTHTIHSRLHSIHNLRILLRLKVLILLLLQLTLLHLRLTLRLHRRTHLLHLNGHRITLLQVPTGCTLLHLSSDTM